MKEEVKEKEAKPILTSIEESNNKEHNNVIKESLQIG